ncbi:MAG TPA: CPBP family intramembrane glutamic endopeptidase [Candidatus Limnocylindrales bacterium]|nr:CPBP family intramembrane glutamic endopeptidase [Candidatus Limnocylindrales bacterium]
MENDLRILVGLGFTLLLVMLRLEAQRFGAAEYDEPVRGVSPSAWRKLAWYALGVGGVVVLTQVHPTPEFSLHLTVGDRAGILLAIVLAVIGVGQAVGLAWMHYHRLRLPDIAAYPAGLANEVITAFIDEAVFRGALIGYLLWAMNGAVVGGSLSAGTADYIAILGSTVVYVLATRLGAPGRDRYMLAVAVVIGLVGGWATVITGGIGASFLGHASTRIAIFLTTGHAGQPPAKGTEVEDVERRRRTPDGWRAVDRSGARER